MSCISISLAADVDAICNCIENTDLPPVFGLGINCTVVYPFEELANVPFVSATGVVDLLG